ncbi:MAG TPA: tRNA 2-selenouridine(34) synthase MnmH [Caulobacteraceae bacterium]|nr:tRNA 2-selenouridine(34) synthase MnmH [Caulobacteraceae bacterium]
MIQTLPSADPDGFAAFDDIVDVRSPAEFAEDHMPGAISLPVLDDEERARVGTIYVQESRFKARRLGAALVARNIARHLEEGLRDKPGSWAPLVYCWRGGQRSNAFATVVEQVGWRPTVLVGGYRTYRRRVTAALYDAQPDFRVILLDGYTGVAKTEVLRRLAGLGVQTIDLEGLAAHRGSLFGAFPGKPQPHQKGFESALLAAIDGLDRARPVVVEAESSKVGALNLPPTLWKAMLAAPRIELAAPREARARYTTCAYGDIIADPAALDEILGKLPVHHGKERRAEWRDLAAAKAFTALAAGLMEHHYDPAYERSQRKETRPCVELVSLNDLETASLDAAAARISDFVEHWNSSE